MLQHVAVTGANGYLGRSLVKMLRDQGVGISYLGRSKPGNIADETAVYFPWELGTPASDDALKKPNGDPVDAVIHLAHNWDDLRPLDENSNYLGTKLLLEQVREAQVGKFVVASTPSANAEATNQYGRVKYAIQQLLDGQRELALQVTIAYGGERSSQWGSICGLVSALPVLPMVAPGTKVQIVHVSKVSEAFIKLADLENPPMPVFAIGSKEGIPFGDFLRKTASVVFRRRLVILPVPLIFALTAAAICRRIPGLPNVSADRVRGISGIKHINTTDTLSALDINVGTFEEMMWQEPGKRVRALLEEAAIFMRYLTGRAPRKTSLKGYVRTLTSDQNAKPVQIPVLAKLMPSLLCLFDLRGSAHPSTGGELRRRLDIALAIADATHGTAFYRYRNQAPVLAIIRLALTAVVELLILPVRFLSRKIFDN